MTRASYSEHRHPTPTLMGGIGARTNHGGNSFGNVSVDSNTVVNTYCCGCKARLIHAEAEPQKKLIFILYLQQFSATQTTSLLSADAMTKLTKEEMDRVVAIHAAEKQEWIAEKRALQKREARAKATAENAKAELAQARASGNAIFKRSPIDDTNDEAAGGEATTGSNQRNVVRKNVNKSTLIPSSQRLTCVLHFIACKRCVADVCST